MRDSWRICVRLQERGKIIVARYRYQIRDSFRASPRRKRRAVSCRTGADDVVEHEGGFCRRTHVTSDSFSTPASRRRAFIPTRLSTPPFASLEQHPARPDWSARRGARVGDRSATRGFYGNGGGVARDNLVIGIAAAGIRARGGFGARADERAAGRRILEDGGETKASAK